MRRRHLLCIGIAVAATIVAAGAVNAQAGGLVGGATNTVKNTTSGVKDTVGNTVKDTTGTVKDTTSGVKNTAGSTVGTVTGSGSGGGSSTGTSGVTGTVPTGTTGTGGATGTTGTTGTTGGSGSTTGGAAGPGGRRGSGGKSGGHGSHRGRNGGTAAPSHPMSMPHTPQQKPNGVPTKFNPSLSVVAPNASPFATPSFIGQFEIPPFLLPIYQACGTQYGIPWQVLASINKIETAFGTNMGPSTAGAEGWMQFMPSTWKTWGIDANGDNRADPYNPVDAICSAARYLQASGGATNLRQAIFAYNHASWYVDEVLATAQQYGKLPDTLVGSLTGLTAGDRFPIAAKSRYAEPTGSSPIFAAQGAGGMGKALAKFGGGPVHLNPGVNMSVGQEPQIKQALSALAAEVGKPVYVISGYRSPAHSVAVGGFANDPHTKGIAADIGVGSPTRDSVASVSDAQLRAVGLFRPFSAPSEINHVQLLYGASSTSGSAQGINVFSQQGAPVVAVNDGTIKAIGHSRSMGNYIVLQDDYGNKFIYWQLGSIRPARKELKGKSKQQRSKSSKAKSSPAISKGQPNRRRLFALPERQHNVSRASVFGQLRPNLLTAPNAAGSNGQTRPHQAPGTLHRGSRVTAGTLLARVGKTDGLAPHIDFAIQPTGIGSGSVDPKPILDGWQLLHETAAYSVGQNPLRNVAKPSDAINDLLMPSSALARRALADPRLDIYRCGRTDIRSGKIDRRVLATMNFLADNGFRLSIASLECDGSRQSSTKGSSKSSAGGSSGSASEIAAEHSSGDAMAISKVDGLPVAKHQGPGSPAESVIKTVLGQQGVMEPDQVTSQQNLPGPVSSSVSGKRGDRIDIGFTPLKSDSTYQSPFEHAIKGRIDQGVDYVGQGSINAIGNARILRVGAPGWPNGGAGPAGQGVLYKLLDGPQQGSIVFVYEGLRPTVKAGDEVVAGQQIATFYPGSSIEIGFANSAGVPLAHAHYTEGKETGWGRKMDHFLSSVGAPGKQNNRFVQMLSPQEWDSVMKQMQHINNPNVQPGSHSEPPAKPHTGPSGPTGPSK